MDSRESGLTYYYYGSNANLSKGLNGKYDPLYHGVKSWKIGETVKVTLDMEKHEITWFKDGKKMGTLDVEENKTYYAAICVNGASKTDRHEFKLSFDNMEVERVAEEDGTSSEEDSSDDDCLSSSDSENEEREEKE